MAESILFLQWWYKEPDNGRMDIGAPIIVGDDDTLDRAEQAIRDDPFTASLFNLDEFRALWGDMEARSPARFWRQPAKGHPRRVVEDYREAVAARLAERDTDPGDYNAQLLRRAVMVADDVASEDQQDQGSAGGEQEQQATNRSGAGREVERVAKLYRQAVEADASLSTDREVWERLKETHDPADLPQSWSAFRGSLTRARREGLLEPKRAPRSPDRATGKSVVRARDHI